MTTTIDELLSQTRKKMASAVDVTREQLNSLRTDRASSAMVANIKVDYHGTMMPIEHLAKISVAESRQLIIQPWDSTVVEGIRKAIQTSELGINPSVEGQLIRIIIPPMSGERRQQIAKTVKTRGEEGKIAIRNVRRDANEKLRELEKAGEASEDEAHRAQGTVQKITDEHIDTLSGMVSQKEAEVLTV